MTALLPILERQADGRPDEVADQLSAPFSEADLLAELDEQADACRALAEVALGRGLAPSPFELSQLVLETLWLLRGSTVDEVRAAMVEDAVVVHAGGGAPERLRRADDWTVLFGTMGAITGLAKLLAADGGGPASAYVRLAFDVPEAGAEPSTAARSSLSRSASRPSRSSSHPAGTAAPSGALPAVEQWAAQRLWHHDANDVDPHDARLGARQRGKAITIVESRRVLEPQPDESDWHDRRVAQLRWVAASGGWSLYCSDRSDRWHRCHDPITADLDDLLAVIDADADHVFWR
jgi:hypothetical protein